MTHTITISNHLQTTNVIHNLAGCAFHNLLSKKQLIQSQLNFDSLLNVKKYLIIKLFSENTTLILTKQPPTYSSIIDLFKEAFDELFVPITLDDYK